MNYQTIVNCVCVCPISPATTIWPHHFFRILQGVVVGEFREDGLDFCHDNFLHFVVRLSCV
jgi:hypothetical protein